METNKFEKYKKRIFEIVEASRNNDIASRSYDMLTLVAIIVGLIPLMTKFESPYTRAIDFFTSILFLIDYIIRLYTADYKMGIKSYKAYLAYILSPMAIIDLLSVVPALALFFPTNNAIALFRIFRVALLLKLLRYSKSMITLSNVFKKVKRQLLAVMLLTLVYIIGVAMVMFQMEPDIFDTFLDAIYWAAISITSVGYGDIAPVTEWGRIISAISSLIGVAVIALPTGIITAAYTDELKRKKSAHEL